MEWCIKKLQTFRLQAVSRKLFCRAHALSFIECLTKHIQQDHALPRHEQTPNYHQLITLIYMLYIKLGMWMWGLVWPIASTCWLTWPQQRDKLMALEGQRCHCWKLILPANCWLFASGYWWLCQCPIMSNNVQWLIFGMQKTSKEFKRQIGWFGASFISFSRDCILRAPSSCIPANC